MTALQAGLGAFVGLLIWSGLNLRHLRSVQRWARAFSRPRIPRSDRPLVAIAGAIAMVILGIGLVMQTHWAFGLTIALAGIGCIVESTVRVVPHLRAGEQGMAMDHILMGIVLLAVLILGMLGWNRLPPLVPEM
ncbi:MAG: hypothetical protein GXP39_18515 [Chloroflexi bacterium]|nr:hypothetical protein [Chloroflexota bacterium]